MVVNRLVPILYRMLAFGAFDDFSDFVKSINYGTSKTCQERSDLSTRINKLPKWSKKIEKHTAAIALHMMHYIIVRIHQTLRTTPAMAAGVTNRLWEMSDIVALLEATERGLERAA